MPIPGYLSLQECFIIRLVKSVYMKYIIQDKNKIIDLNTYLKPLYDLCVKYARDELNVKHDSVFVCKNDTETLEKIYYNTLRKVGEILQGNTIVIKFDGKKKCLNKLSTILKEYKPDFTRNIKMNQKKEQSTQIINKLCQVLDVQHTKFNDLKLRKIINAIFPYNEIIIKNKYIFYVPSNCDFETFKEMLITVSSYILWEYSIENPDNEMPINMSYNSLSKTEIRIIEDNPFPPPLETYSVSLDDMQRMVEEVNVDNNCSLDAVDDIWKESREMKYYYTDLACIQHAEFMNILEDAELISIWKCILKGIDNDDIYIEEDIYSLSKKHLSYKYDRNKLIIDLALYYISRFVPIINRVDGLDDNPIRNAVREILKYNPKIRKMFSCCAYNLEKELDFGNGNKDFYEYIKVKFPIIESTHKLTWWFYKGCSEYDIYL